MSSSAIRIPASRAAATSGVAHRVGVVVRRAVGLVVQVVELPDRGDPGGGHLAVRRPGQREVGVGVERAPATAYICSRQVQNVPRSRWVRPRSARWNAWLWQLARPGRVRPGTRRGFPGRPGKPALVSRGLGRQAGFSADQCDGGEPPVLDLTSTSSWTAPSTHARSRRYDDAAHRASLSSVSASAETPTRQSAISACSSGECETPVGLRTNSIAVGMPAADRIPASWPACGRDHRPVAALVVGGEPPRPAPGRRRPTPDTDSAVTVSEVPSRRARSRGLPAIASTSAASAVVGRAARVQPRGHPRRHRVGAVGRRPRPARRSPAAPPAAPACWPPARSSRRSASGRPGPPSGWCPAWLAAPGEVEAVAPVRPDLARHPDRRAPVDQVAALLDVQLDEAADAVQQRRSARPRRRGPSPARRQRVRQRHPVAVAQRRAPPPRPSRRWPAASRGRPARSASPPPRRTPTPRPAAPARTRARAAGRRAASAETTPSGPSYAPPSSTESRCEPVSTPGPEAPGGAHQADHVADAVGLDRSPRAAPARRTTRAARSPPRSERLPEVAAGRRRPPDRREVGPHPLEVVRHARSHGVPGRRTPPPDGPQLRRRRRSTRPSSTGRSHNATRAPNAGFSQGWAFLVLDTPEDVRRFWRGHRRRRRRTRTAGWPA